MSSFSRANRRAGWRIGSGVASAPGQPGAVIGKGQRTGSIRLLTYGPMASQFASALATLFAFGFPFSAWARRGHFPLHLACWRQASASDHASPPGVPIGLVVAAV